MFFLPIIKSDTLKIVERLNYDQKVVLYKELIQNLVGLESLVGDKREELEPFELFNWLDGQLIPLEQKQVGVSL